MSDNQTTNSISAQTFFSEIIFNKIMDMTPEEQSRVFEMLTNYIDVLYNLFDNDSGHDVGNHPLFDHIKGTPWAYAKKIIEENQSTNPDDSHIDYDKPQKLIDAYDAWKSAQ